MIRRVESGTRIAVFWGERIEHMRPRAPKKYESLLFFNLGFCSVLMLVGFGACRPQVVRNGDRSITVVNLDAVARPKIDPESEGVSVSALPILDSLTREAAFNFARTPLESAEAGLGASVEDAARFADRFGAISQNHAALDKYIRAYRFFVKTKETLSSPQTVTESMAFAERIYAFSDCAEVLTRYENIFDLALRSGLGKGRAFNLADRYQSLEQSTELAEKFVRIFEHGKGAQLDEEMAVRLAEKYSVVANGDSLIEQWLSHFNSQQGRMPPGQAVLYADQQIASQIPKTESTPVQQETLVDSDVNPSSTPEVEPSVQTHELGGAVF
jgi:hypothetical protein